MATTSLVRLSMPLYTSPKEPLPMRSSLVKSSSGSTRECWGDVGEQPGQGRMARETPDPFHASYIPFYSENLKLPPHRGKRPQRGLRDQGSRQETRATGKADGPCSSPLRAHSPGVGRTQGGKSWLRRNKELEHGNLGAVGQRCWATL